MEVPEYDSAYHYVEAGGCGELYALAVDGAHTVEAVAAGVGTACLLVMGACLLISLSRKQYVSLAEERYVAFRGSNMQLNSSEQYPASTFVCYGSSNPMIHISKERRGIFGELHHQATSSLMMLSSILLECYGEL